MSFNNSLQICSANLFFFHFSFPTQKINFDKTFFCLLNGWKRLLFAPSLIFARQNQQGKCARERERDTQREAQRTQIEKDRERETESKK
jgi:hypothetical protein